MNYEVIFKKRTGDKVLAMIYYLEKNFKNLNKLNFIIVTKYLKI